MNSIQATLLIVILCFALSLRSSVAMAKASPQNDAPGDFASIDNYVNAQRVRLGIPGLSLGIVQGNQVVHSQGFGVVDSTGRAVTPQTPFHIGSLSKSFTALAVMQLAEAGKVDLDAPVQTYLPWFTLADREASAKITVCHLLNQTSGISEKDGNRFWNSTMTMEEAVRQMNTIKLRHPAGAKYQYSNLNFVVLGLSVEKVSGQSYADYVAEHIFTQLEMRNSHTSHSDAIEHGLPDGNYYVLNHAFKREGVYPPAYLSTGLLVSSAEDMAHYLIAQLNGGKYGEASVLSPQGIAELHKPDAPMRAPGYYYAMGWVVNPFDGVNSIWHNGDITNFHGVVILQPEKRRVIVILANATGFAQIRLVDDIAKGALNLMNDKRPDPITAPFAFQFSYRSVLLTPLPQSAWIVYSILNRQPDGWRGSVAVALNLTVAILFLFGVPGLVPFPLSSLIVYYPEIGYALRCGAALGIGSGLAKAIAFFWAR